jgi:hypothetical protein
VPNGDTLARREFTLQSIMAVLGALTITLSGYAAEGPTQPMPYADQPGNVGSNHGHTVVITGAQLSAGGAVVLDIQGSASHPHQIRLTADEVRMIGEGRRLSKDSSASPSGSHAHTVIFN